MVVLLFQIFRFCPRSRLLRPRFFNLLTLARGSLLHVVGIFNVHDQKEQCSDFLRTQPDEHPFSWFNLVLFYPSNILLIMMKILGAIAVQYCVPITRGRSHILNIFQKWPISPSCCIISHYHMHHTTSTLIQHSTGGKNDSNLKPMCQWSFDTKSKKCVCHDTCLILWSGWCIQQCRPPQWCPLLCKSPSKMPKAAGWPSLVLLCV